MALHAYAKKSENNSVYALVTETVRRNNPSSLVEGKKKKKKVYRI